MSRKINSNWRSPLSGTSILSISGADTVSFLQGQLSNDMHALDDAHCQRSAYHQPDGRVLAVPLVLLQGSEASLVLPTDIVEDIRERLSRYVLRAKVEFSVSAGLCGLSGADLTAKLPSMPIPQPGCVTRTAGGLLLAAYSSQRILACGPPDNADWQLIDDALAEEPEAVWQLADIRDGIPQVTTANQTRYTAQMLNLDLIGAISFSKGCYAGQEIIARTQNLGKIKRRLCRLGSETEIAGDEVSLANGNKVGEILNRQKSTGNGKPAWEYLAVIRLDQRQAGLYNDGTPLSLLDLPYAIPD
ncbi:MAG: folate-binding protein YgfZ [Proteobacteria bacterium]|nr:folate-binding protein YgfZ [Pseudomonadota bacterium]